MRRCVLAALMTWVCAAAMAQPSMQVDAPRQWVGELVYKTPKTVTFKFQNTGDMALQIKDVHPSCGCVVTTFPKMLIPAGMEGEITAVYDASIMGTFYRELAVYTNASDFPTYLTFEGRVVETPSDADYENNFPIDLGSIRMNTNVIEFDDVNKGDRPMAELLVLNLKKEDFKPELMHLPSYVSVNCVPNVIQGGRVGRVRLTLDSEGLLMNGLNQTSIYMARYQGDKVGDDNEILLSAVLLPSFSNLTASELERAPHIVLRDGDEVLEGDLDLSASNGKKKKDKSVSKVVQVTNTGDSELNITALQVMNRAVSVSLGNRVIPPHGSTKLKINVDLKQLEQTKNWPRVLIISNDPHNAKIILSLNIDE